jgi:hypothetical protein
VVVVIVVVAPRSMHALRKNEKIIAVVVVTLNKKNPNLAFSFFSITSCKLFDQIVTSIRLA